MIKAAGTHKNGVRHFIFGISKRDLSQLLEENRPLEVDGEDIGLPGKVVVFYGKDDEEILTLLAQAGVILPTQSR